MTYENVRLSFGNVCTDRDHLYVASFDSDLQAVVEKDKTTGVVQNTWPADTPFSEVFSLEYDGYYWWTLEQNPLGIVIRKWERVASTFASLISSFSLSTTATMEIYSEAFCVEPALSILSLAAGPSVSSVTVDDASSYRVGDEIIFGPSSHVGYVGRVDKATITSVAGNTIQFSPPLSSAFSGGDWAVSPKSVWVFNDGGNGTVGGSLIKLRAASGAVQLVDHSSVFSGVRSATYYSGYLLFGKGPSVLWYDASTITLSKSMAIDSFKSDRATSYQMYDLYVYSDVLYRLQLGTSYYSVDEWKDEEWLLYSLCSSNVISEVYMVALSAEVLALPVVYPPMITSTSSLVHCVVYDQYFSPASGVTVDFSSTAGSLNPAQAVTDSNGSCYTQYNGDTTEALVTVTATTS